MALFFKKNKNDSQLKAEKETSSVSAETAKSDEKPEAAETKQNEPLTPAAEENKPNVINQLVGNLGTALDEDIEEMDELMGAIDSEDGDKLSIGKTRGFIIFGVVVLVFSIIGFIASIEFTVNTAQDIINRKSLKQEFLEFVYPVVVTDPPEFEKAENLPPSTVLASSILKIILFGDTRNYEKDAGIMTIPAIDVEASVRSIFGNSYDITHRSIDDYGYLFDYDAGTNSYIVPEKPQYTAYTPRIAEIENDGATFNVTIEYIYPNPLVGAGIATDAEEPVKTLVYTILRTNDTKTITSVNFPFNIS